MLTSCRIVLQPLIIFYSSLLLSLSTTLMMQNVLSMCRCIRSIQKNRLLLRSSIQNHFLNRFKFVYRTIWPSVCLSAFLFIVPYVQSMYFCVQVIGPNFLRTMTYARIVRYKKKTAISKTFRAKSLKLFVFRHIRVGQFFEKLPLLIRLFRKKDLTWHRN